jgi:methionyl-tRNA formyltransferase
MNIILFVNKDIEANIAYNLLKPELLNHSVQIYYTDSVGNPKDKNADLLKFEYFEKEFVFDKLLSFKTDNQIDNTFEFFDRADFQSFSIKKCFNVNSQEFIEEVKGFKPNLFISIRFGNIFKDEILSLPNRGTLNLHSGSLPDFRGIMGTLHAIKAGKKNVGCTLHTIPDSGIDTGQIIEKANLHVDYDKSLFWHVVQLYPLGVDLIVKYLKKMNADESFRVYNQNLSIGQYFSVPMESDFSAIRELGMKVFSASDYLGILKEFILKNISTCQEKNLLEMIEENWNNNNRIFQ